MQLTPKLNLKKPDLTDSINVQDLNDNMDVLDTAVSELQEGSASIPDLETNDKTLAGAINELKQTVNDVETNAKKYTDQHAAELSHVKWIETVGGTANALTTTLDGLTSYKNGLGVSFPIKSNSTAAMSLNINGLGAIPIKKANGTPFSNGIVNGVYTVRYREGAFILQGESEVEIGKQIIKPSTTKQTILKGLHDGTGYVEGDSNLTASNILAGKTIFGITGNVQPKQFRTYSVYGEDAFVKFEWDFPYTAIVITNAAGSYNIYLAELPNDNYFGGGNYMPGFPKSRNANSIECYFYKMGGWYTIKVYG
ncbi:hypothetical protein [Lysinibacillus sphaericus]|uniref:hypothetical protein n=1 Tax=Lysinibacillus sphaericus TaxID=1421 RepID=UPI002DBB2D98|nr:hypothetical protein [Lysinibacillus sphaericus]MEB7455142.1 hypothetical protein [Lysinibacillus sphaericus]